MLQAVTPFQFNSSCECADYLLKRWDANSLLNYENMYAVFLDSDRCPVFHHRLNEGNQSETLFDVLRTLHYAYSVHSRCIILAHNHVSQIALPSKRDIEVTQTLLMAFSIIGITLFDNLIVTTNGYYSFRDHGKLDKERPFSAYNALIIASTACIAIGEGFVSCMDRLCA